MSYEMENLIATIICFIVVTFLFVGGIGGIHHLLMAMGVL